MILLNFVNNFLSFRLLTTNKSAGDYHLDYFLNIFHLIYQNISSVQNSFKQEESAREWALCQLTECF